MGGRCRKKRLPDRSRRLNLKGDDAMEINMPAVVADVRRAFDAYETALMANDMETLQALFWDHAAVIRYGTREVLKGKAEIAAFRQARDTSDLARTIEDLVITTYGDAMATAFCEYRRIGSGRRGKQSQTWIRTPEGWRVAAAHVSLGED
jgi:ketosteroid isomerase-like protein